MGSNDKCIYFIANGHCMVSIKNHLNQRIVVDKLVQGDYFGENAVIFGSSRSANIESINYCTLAHLSVENFNKLCHFCPDVYLDMKQKALTSYNDEWIQFKITLLK